MPIHHEAKGWYWGGQGPFPTKEKAQEVRRAAFASGYRGKLRQSSKKAGAGAAVVIGGIVVGLALAGKASGGGGNGGNGGNGGPDTLTFSSPNVDVVPSTGASAYRTINFSCTVTNNTNKVISTVLHCMRRIQDGSVAEINGTGWGFTPPGPVSVTLSPGDSYTYHFEGNYQYDGGWYAWTAIPFGGSLTVWLQDSQGNKSPEIGPLT